MGNTETKNEVFITGRVISVYKNDNGSARLTVITKNGKDVYAKCYCPPGVLPSFNLRTRICVKGYLNTYMHRDRSGIVRNTQQIVVESIYRDATILEQKYGIKGHFYRPFTCEILLTGRVKAVQDAGAWINMTLEVDNDVEDRRAHSVRVGMKKIDRQPSIKEGDIVYTVCSLSTPRKEIEEKSVEFTNVVVHDIAVASSANSLYVPQSFL